MVLNIISIVIGALGAIAGVGAAIWVYRQQKRDAHKDRLIREQRNAEERTEEKRLVAEQRAEDQRQAELTRVRDVRRIKHQDDYRAIGNLLDRASEAGWQVRVDQLWHREAADRARISDLTDELTKMADRVPNLMLELDDVERGIFLIQDGILRDDADPATVRLILQVVKQYESWRLIERSVEKARKALNREWER